MIHVEYHFSHKHFLIYLKTFCSWTEFSHKNFITVIAAASQRHRVHQAFSTVTGHQATSNEAKSIPAYLLLCQILEI